MPAVKRRGQQRSPSLAVSGVSEEKLNQPRRLQTPSSPGTPTREWTCRTCTLKNEPGIKSCSMCDTPSDELVSHLSLQPDDTKGHPTQWSLESLSFGTLILIGFLIGMLGFAAAEWYRVGLFAEPPITPVPPCLPAAPA